MSWQLMLFTKTIALKRKNTAFLGGTMFYMYLFFSVPNWPKICIFIGLRFSSTSPSSPISVIFFRSPTPGAI